MEYSAPLNKPVLVSWSHPQVQDNSAGNLTITYRLPGTSAPAANNSAEFGLGTHELTVLAEDEEGNVGQCHFNITIKGTTTTHFCLRFRVKP